jgi:hypothetical protein
MPADANCEFVHSIRKNGGLFGFGLAAGQSRRPEAKPRFFSTSLVYKFESQAKLPLTFRLGVAYKSLEKISLMAVKGRVKFALTRCEINSIKFLLLVASRGNSIRKSRRIPAIIRT